MAENSANPRFHLGLRDTLRVLLPYVKRNFLNQIQGIWFIVAYLIVFQILVLRLPIVYAGMIAAGIFLVAVGLMAFMEGLRLGLMPLGEVIGSVLPQTSRMPLILGFAFLLGVGATFAEPAIAVLKAAGSGVPPDEAPLLYSLLNSFSGQLVASVGVGVGLAVVLGVLRFFYGWPLKYLAVPTVTLLLGISLFYSQNPVLADVLGLAWDCGAVTTGPVTVPLVLALGIGVCRVVSSGGGGHSGFGVVTLASLFPVLAVLLLAFVHYSKADYYGAANYAGDVIATERAEQRESVPTRDHPPISDEEYREYLQTRVLPGGYDVQFTGGEPVLVDGDVVLTAPQVVIRKEAKRKFDLVADQAWDGTLAFGTQTKQAVFEAIRAIVPLCLFLYVVLRIVLRQRLDRDSDVGIGISFALTGMALFGLGIGLGLTPLGGQLGSNVPLTFASIVPWGGDYREHAMFAEHFGKFVAIGFAFFLGYGATLAEPALNALGDTVQRITVGAFRKKLLMQSVAVGVGIGIAAGVVKMAYGVPLIAMLVPGYLAVIMLTVISPHHFVNFSWDSAGVTTGPITVPLVLAMGLGIGANVPGVSDGFGILALASVGPILTVLSVGLYTQRQRTETTADIESEAPAKVLS